MNRLADLVRVILLIAVLASSVSSGFAKRRPAARRHQTLISSVSANSITIEEDNGPKTFAITAFTEVFVNEQRASAAQLKPGMRVSVTLDDPTRLHRIKAWSTE